MLEVIGYHRFLFSYSLEQKDEYMEMKRKLEQANIGDITEVYINNGYAFEIKLYNIVM